MSIVRLLKLSAVLAPGLVLAACGRNAPESEATAPQPGAAVVNAAPAVEVPNDGLISLSEQFTSDFNLVDFNGAPVSNEDLKGKVTLVYFGFASCPDVCPLALGRMSAALNELSEVELAEITPVFITVDPDRDTPEALKSFLAFDPRIIGLSGEMAAIETAKASFKVYAQIQKTTEEDVNYDVQHTSLFYLLDREAQPKMALHDYLTPQELAEMLRRAIKWK